MAGGPTPMNNEAAQQQQQAMVAKMLETAKPKSCKECGCQAYEQAIALMEVSALDPNNPTGKEQHLNYPVLCCIKCKNIFDPMGKVS